MTSALDSEFETIELGDVRLNRRAQAAIEALARQPAAGATTALTAAELEGYYRFVNNERVSLQQMLASHLDATRRRLGERTRVVVAHDTTDFRFADEAEREGLGPMDNGGQGFYAHFSLAVGHDRCAFGVVGLETWTRKARHSARRTQTQRYKDPEKESLRWGRAVNVAESAIGEGRRVVHVMDREADDYDLLCDLVAGSRSFVVRSSFDRRLIAEGARLKSFVCELEVRCEREVELASRRKSRPEKQRKLYPPRSRRSATLSFSASAVTVRRPDKSRAPLPDLTLNIVHVREVSAPEGLVPVEWTLLTSEPIDHPDQVVQIADDYRARWVIEEYFKALKSGCAYEKRQHESKDALFNALGLFVPIAWSLLNLRTLSRNEEAAARPADEVFTPSQIQILRRKSNGKLSARPTVGEAALLMARLLGGLQPSNGHPGWQILGRAYQHLLQLEAGWRLAMAELDPGRSDR